MQLIEFNGGMYQISEPILARWLEVEYNKRGIYPHRFLIYFHPTIKLAFVKQDGIIIKKRISDP